MFLLCARRLASLLAVMCCLLPTRLPAAVPAPRDEKPPRPAGATAKAIDTLLARHWKKNGLTPAAQTTDHEFLRRVTLDLIGRIATLEEVRAFVRDAHPDKRLRLIDRLLASSEFTDFWAEVWTDWLLHERVAAAERDRFAAWLRGYFLHNHSAAVLAEKLLTASGKPSAILDELFVAAYNRPPTVLESQRLLRDLAEPGQEVSATAWKDLFWALLSSSAFADSH